MRLNLMRCLQLSFVGQQRDLPGRNLLFQLAIPPLKPRPRLSRDKQGDSGHQREKRAVPDIDPIQLKQMVGPSHDPARNRCDPTRYCGDWEKNA